MARERQNRRQRRSSAINWVVGLVIASVPFLLGAAFTGHSIAVPALGRGGNNILGWVMVFAGLIALYQYFSRKE